MAPKKDDTSGLRVLGAGAMGAPTSGPTASLLEWFPNRFPQRLYVVSLTFAEYTSLCPVTGQPDFGRIEVAYVPADRCVESKSFKLYMFSYRTHQSFMETIVNTMLEDLVTVLAPHWCRVLGCFAARGGVAIHVSATHWSPQSGDSVRQCVDDFMRDGNAARPWRP